MVLENLKVPTEECVPFLNASPQTAPAAFLPRAGERVFLSMQRDESRAGPHFCERALHRHTHGLTVEELRVDSDLVGFGDEHRD